MYGEKPQPNLKHKAENKGKDIEQELQRIPAKIQTNQTDTF